MPLISSRAFVDFGNDLTHQFAQEFIAGTGQGDLLLSGGRIDFQNISANTIARTEGFPSGSSDV